MGKHDLPISVSKREPVLEPEIVGPTSAGRGTGSNGSSMADFLRSDSGGKVLSGSMEIAKMIVEGQREISTIHATADAKIKEIDAEIRRIAEESRSYVEKAGKDNEVWHSQFDKKAAELRKIVAELDKHPDWSDELKKKMVDAILQLAHQ